MAEYADLTVGSEPSDCESTDDLIFIEKRVKKEDDDDFPHRFVTGNICQSCVLSSFLNHFLALAQIQMHMNSLISMMILSNLAWSFQSQFNQSLFLI